MRHFQITSCVDKSIIFEGQFYRFRHCLEQAVKEHVELQCADLTRRNLCNAMLDDAKLAHADFSGSNLTGANLSEAQLSGASFVNTDLYNTCFAGSDLRACRFEGASFGGTDITGCDISHSRFSTTSCFSLEFARAASMQGCLFTNPDGLRGLMSRPPVVIRGGNPPMMVFMDECLKIDHDLLDMPEGIALLKSRQKVH